MASATTTTTMRAARYHGKEDIRIESIPTVPCGKDQIKIAPAFVGICGTDLHEFLGGPKYVLLLHFLPFPFIFLLSFGRPNVHERLVC